MNVKVFVYIIYILTMGLSGLIMASSGLSLKNSKYWALLVCFFIVYICGYIHGGA